MSNVIENKFYDMCSQVASYHGMRELGNSGISYPFGSNWYLKDIIKKLFEKLNPAFNSCWDVPISTQDSAISICLSSDRTSYVPIEVNDKFFRIGTLKCDVINEEETLFRYVSHCRMSTTDNDLKYGVEFKPLPGMDLEHLTIDRDFLIGNRVNSSWQEVWKAENFFKEAFVNDLSHSVPQELVDNFKCPDPVPAECECKTSANDCPEIHCDEVSDDSPSLSYFSWKNGIIAGIGGALLFGAYKTGQAAVPIREKNSDETVRSRPR